MFGRAMIAEMKAFCEIRGFKRPEFGNGPQDTVLYCKKENRITGYRYTCCK